MIANVDNRPMDTDSIGYLSIIKKKRATIPTIIVKIANISNQKSFFFYFKIP